jgi:uncharacterized protein (TIGR03435 family)
MRLMMQSLLQDRFKMTIHTETRQLPVYALVLESLVKRVPTLSRIRAARPAPTYLRSRFLFLRVRSLHIIAVRSSHVA